MMACDRHLCGQTTRNGEIGERANRVRGDMRPMVLAYGDGGGVRGQEFSPSLEEERVQEG